MWSVYEQLIFAGKQTVLYLRFKQRLLVCSLYAHVKHDSLYVCYCKIIVILLGTIITQLLIRTAIWCF